MKVITLAHQKGGVGKSTLTLNLAASFAQDENLRVGILDIDPQGSLSQSAKLFQGIGLAPFPGAKKLHKILEYADSFDILFVDTPPYLSSEIPELFLLSDLVVVPTKLGLYDYLAIQSTIALIIQAQKTKPELLATIVINMLKPRPKLNAEFRAEMDTAGLPICSTTISDRSAYVRSPMESGIYSLGDKTAQREIGNLTDELITLLS